MKQMTDLRMQELAKAFEGRVYAYVGTATPYKKFGLGIAEANLQGYAPIPLGYFSANTLEDAMDEAERLNRKLGLTEDLAALIAASAMRRPLIAPNRTKKDLTHEHSYA